MYSFIPSFPTKGQPDKCQFYWSCLVRQISLSTVGNRGKTRTRKMWIELKVWDAQPSKEYPKKINEKTRNNSKHPIGDLQLRAKMGTLNHLVVFLCFVFFSKFFVRSCRIGVVVVTFWLWAPGMTEFTSSETIEEKIQKIHPSQVE